MEPDAADRLAQRVQDADRDAVLASWAFGLDITGVRPGEWNRYLERTYDKMVAGLEEGGEQSPSRDAATADGGEQRGDLGPESS